MSDQSPKLNRREFLRGSLRYLILGGLVSVTGALFAKGKISRDKCINLGICGGCSIFKNCELPPAVTVRETMQPQESETQDKIDKGQV